jgi:hypothetical protein
MFASNQDHFGSSKESCGRSPRPGGPVRLTGLALAVAGLCALVPATAAAGQADKRSAPRFEHSAKSGGLGGGRLVLRGVHRRVPVVHNNRRSGVVSVRRLHERLFLPGKPVLGALEIARHRGGAAPRLRLSRPRYNAARRTVSYRIKRLDKRPLPRRFGAASLSMVGRAQDQQHCEASVNFNSGEYFYMAVDSYSAWDTDTWDVTPYFSSENDSDTWQSDGGDLRGCGNTVNLQLVPEMNGWGGEITISVSFDWQGNLTTNTCTVTNADSNIKCDQEPNVAPITYRVHSSRFP